MPDFSLAQLLGFGGTCFATSLAVLGLFWKADDAFSDEFRELLSKKLQGMKIETSGANWPLFFSQIFDRTFGENHLSWKCFARSCIVSTLSVLLLFALSRSIYQYEYRVDLFTDFLILLLYLCSLNLIPDYLSLLETRWIVGLIARHCSATIITILMIVDIVITILIFLIIGSVLFFVFTEFLFPEPRYSFSSYIDFIGEMYNEVTSRGIYLDSGTSLPSAGVFFYSTLFTSAWIWLFVTGWFAVRNGARFQRVLAALQFALPIRTKPMRAIGEVAAIVTALAFVVLGIFGVDFEPTNLTP